MHSCLLSYHQLKKTLKGESTSDQIQHKSCLENIKWKCINSYFNVADSPKACMFSLHWSESERASVFITDSLLLEKFFWLGLMKDNDGGKSPLRRSQRQKPKTREACEPCSVTGEWMYLHTSQLLALNYPNEHVNWHGSALMCKGNCTARAARRLVSADPA